MKKKFLGFLFVAGLSLSSLSAASFTQSCNLTSAAGSNTATFGGGGAEATVSNAVFTCNAFNLPGLDTLQSVELVITNNFSQAIGGPTSAGLTPSTNTIAFTYTVTGNFNGTSSLTTTISSNPSTASQGQGNDIGNAIGSPDGECSTLAGFSGSYTGCFEDGTLTDTTVTVTGSSSWVSGGLASGGTDEFNVLDIIYTYNPPAPEPASLLMVGGGLVALALATRRKRNKA
jgi:hypothetical protein